MSYTPPAGDQVRLELFGFYAPPPGNQIDLPLGDLIVGPEPVEPFIAPLASQQAIAWGKPLPVALQALIGWASGSTQNKPTALAHRNAKPKHRQKSLNWRGLEPRDKPVGVMWRNLWPRNTVRSLEWQNLQPLEVSKGVRWRDTERQNKPHELAWPIPVIQDVQKGLSWARAEIRHRAYELAYGIGIPRNAHRDLPWGFGQQPRTLVSNPNVERPPPVRPPFPIPDAVYIPPAGNQIDLPLVCRLVNVRGDRIPLPLRRIPCIRSQYVVDNTIDLKRDGESFAASRFDISGDIESFADSWSALVDPEALPLLDPTLGAVEITAEVNGITFLLLVESYSKETRWDDRGGRVDQIRIQGRSVSALLDEPYKQARSLDEAQPKTLFQLMQQELPEGSDWDLEAHPAWAEYSANTQTAVPANTWTYTNRSPIQAIARVANATGAVIQQKHGEETLRIVPRYPVRIWEMDEAQEDVELDAGIIRGQGVEFQPRARANRIFINGTMNGVRVRCSREGESAPSLESITDSLITDPQFGLQRGLAELSATGPRTLERIELPVATGQNEPGLILTGDIVLVAEDEQTAWKGLCIAWSLDCSWSERDGLIIWQSVTLERYRGE